MYDHELDQAVDRIALKQRGAFNLTQLHAIGGDDDAAAHRVAIGRWVRIAPSVLAVTSFPGTYERQCWAAVLGEPQAWVGGFSAATLFGWPDFRPGRPEIVVPPTGNARNPIARVHRYAGAAVTTLRGLPITTPAQTAFDVAGRVDLARLESAIDDQLLTGRMTVDALDERLTAYTDTRRRGLPVMRLLIAERRAEGFAPAVSELERRGDRILRRLPCRPKIVREVSFPWLAGGTGRVDRFLPEYGLIIEFDGRRWHTRVRDFDKDLWRDNQAQAAGLAMLRFTWAHITLTPLAVRAVIEDTLAIRTPNHRALTRPLGGVNAQTLANVG